jgi:NAD(P)H-flavin reductase
MTVQVAPKSMALQPSQPMLPYWAKINEIQPEAPGVATFWLKFDDESVQKGFSFQPGQFNMVYVPGYGEAAISISSAAQDNQRIGHTVRSIGNVTHKMAKLKVGDSVGVRGPFGSYWPLEEAKGSDILIATGGIGFPPLRPVLYHILRHRSDYGRVVLLNGARTPKDLQYTTEYETWSNNGIETMSTVDRADDTWTGQVGVVPILFYRLRMEPQRSYVFTCGPEIMIRYVLFEAMARRVPLNRIFMSLERNMKCGLGSCGHCQIGPYFVCRDGPIFSLEKLQPYYNVEEL